MIYLAIVTGRVPWISLVLALSFGLYGLIRKVVAVDSLPALVAETLLLTPLAAGYLFWLGITARVRSAGWAVALISCCSAAASLPPYRSRSSRMVRAVFRR